MISQRVLGSTEMNVRATAHGGGHENKDWGGIPVIVLFGDDYQLTPPCDEGAIDSFTSSGNSNITKNGAYQFIKLGECTGELNIIVRQDKEQQEFRNILANTRIGSQTDENVAALMSLHLNSNEFSIQDAQNIEKKAMYVFANKKKMKKFNTERLKEQHSKPNPIARLKVQSTSKNVKSTKIPKCFKNDNDIQPIISLCREAKVQICGKNFEPDWGLFNGAVGTVKEIVFNKDENPLDGTLPQYIIVDFPDYCGPPWMENKPTWVPIPQIELSCSNFCCLIRFIPLSLAYAKTGHTFQGQSAGPDHAIKCIIIQPGSCSMEKLCPGLLYMFISRGSTIGEKGNRIRSSIFFVGDELTKERIKNLTKTKSGELCHKIKRRTRWINYLKKTNYM